jgi:hypothetical protein
MRSILCAFGSLHVYTAVGTDTPDNTKYKLSESIALGAHPHISFDHSHARFLTDGDSHTKMSSTHEIAAGDTIQLPIGVVNGKVYSSNVVDSIRILQEEDSFCNSCQLESSDEEIPENWTVLGAVTSQNAYFVFKPRTLRHIRILAVS